jgi:hypothetical protein
VRLLAAVWNVTGSWQHLTIPKLERGYKLANNGLP